MSDQQQADASGKTDLRTEFRQLMGLFATGVCVVAVIKQDGCIAAMTVNSFTSVSLEPRLVCWNLQNSASLYDDFATAENYAVSILTQDQVELARRYAARGNLLFEAGDFTKGDNGLPVIVDALGYLECRQWSQVEAGDHTMLLGEVMGFRPKTESRPGTGPLGFFNGQFCGIG